MKELSGVPDSLRKLGEEYNRVMMRFDQLVTHVGVITDQVKLISDVLDVVVEALEEEGILDTGGYDPDDLEFQEEDKPDLSSLN